MFNSPILDLVILLSFIYFIGSLMLTTINEAIAGYLRLRQKQLRQSLENMFFDPGWKDFFYKNIYNSPFIQTLIKKQGAFPAYIPAENFSSAILEKLIKDDFEVSRVKKAIEDAPVPASLKISLLQFWAEADNNIVAFKKKIDDFYNNSMDRASGWYKRNIRKIQFWVAMVMCVAMNFDTIKIANDALHDPDKLNQSVENIITRLPDIAHGDGVVTIADSAGNIVVQRIPDTSKTVRIGETQKQLGRLKLVLHQQSGYGFGYKSCDDFRFQWTGTKKTARVDPPANPDAKATMRKLAEAPGAQNSGELSGWDITLNIVFKLFGVVITAFALQMGSSYWFDLMIKAVNIRAVGKKPETDKK